MKNVFPGIALIFFTAVHVLAQFPASLKVKRLTTGEGLASNQVHDICQDRQGFVWMATALGVSRFDGYQFVNYNHNPSQPGSLPEGEIGTLYNDRTGNLWLSGLGFINRYDPEKDAFERISVPVSVGARLVSILGQDQRGRLLLSTDGGGGWAFDPEQRTFQLWEPLQLLGQKALGLPINSVLAIGDGKYLLGTWQEGLILLDPQKQRTVTFRHDPARPGSLPGNIVYTIVKDNGGRIWVGTDKGLCRYQPASQSFVRQTLPGKPFVRRLLTDARGWLWIGTEDSGLYILDPETGNFRQYQQEVIFEDRLGANFCSRLYQDRDGNIWANANKKGVHFITRHSLAFSLYRREPEQPASLAGNDVLTLAESPDGLLWIGLDKKGLQSFDRRTGNFRLYQHEPANPASLANNPVLRVLTDRSGSLWVCPWTGGLQKLADPARGRFISYRLENENPYPVGKNSVYALHEDSRGRLWAGTYTDGLFLFDRQAGRWVTNYQPSAERLLNRELWITSIGEDAAGNILAGTINGLYRVDTLQKTLVPVFYGEKRKISVWALFRDRQQHLWAGTSEGLYEISSRLEVVRIITDQEGLPHSAVQGIVADLNNTLWITTENGLAEVDPRTGKVLATFFSEDGLPGNKFNFGATLRLQDGAVALGTSNGMTIFQPGNIRPMAAPALVLTGFHLYNQPQTVGGDSPLKTSISQTRKIELTRQQQVFGFEFAALDFMRPNKNQYAYRMEGFEDQWNYAGPRRFASYTNLPPGDYTFRVRAANHQGVWNEEGISVQVRILPPFWATWWFRLLAFVVVSGGILLLFRFRTRQLEQRQLELSNEVEKQTRRLREANAEISRQNDELQQQKEEIAVQAAQLHELDELKLRFFTNISHEFRTPLTLILSPVEKLLSVPGADDSTRRQYQVIRRNARNLLNLLNQLMDVIKLESGSTRLHPVPGDLVTYLQELTEQFKYLAERQAIHFSVHTECSSLWVHFDAETLEKMLYNLLSNAFKFTPDGGCVSVQLTVEDTQTDSLRAVFTVTDTGIGLSTEQLSHIFEHFYQVHQTVWRKMPGSGVGLALVKQLVELHDGQIEVESAEGNGTTFRMILPLTRVAQVGLPLPDRGMASGTAPGPVTLPDHAPLVLVVEDDAELRAFVGQLLSGEYHIKGAADGLEGWELATRLLPDLIITDIAMPRMDGLKLCQRLKSDERTLPIPVVMLTAKADTADRLGSMNVGADDYLTKPFDPVLLQSRVRQLIAQRKKLRERFTREYKPRPKETGLSDEQFLLRVEQIVEKNIANSDFDVDEFVQEIGMSRAQLYRRIKAVTGVSVGDFIRRTRLRRAAALLAGGGRNIADVMTEVGFSTPSYFTQCFRAEFGCTPTEYQGQLQ